MRILVATDKFKGSLTAQEVAATIGRAIDSIGSNIVDLSQARAQNREAINALMFIVC
jgi:glycerate kinase